uniref:Endonuclease/exonuclease/phosphatase domain-containing protein n=1 Tax=Sinocyclocheilus rhinocerous TaxID=307959 RepID=A0A673KB42_9TELE
NDLWSGDNNNRSSGVGILLKGNSLKVLKTREVINGRLIYVDVKLNDFCFRVINVYFPVDLQGRKEALKALSPLLICGKEIILGGDFNCPLSESDRRSSSNVSLDSSSQELINLVKDFGLVDTFRTKHPDSPGYSWSNGRSFSRIDFLFTSPQITVLNW